MYITLLFLPPSLPPSLPHTQASMRRAEPDKRRGDQSPSLLPRHRLGQYPLPGNLILCIFVFFIIPSSGNHSTTLYICPFHYRQIYNVDKHRVSSYLLSGNQMHCIDKYTMLTNIKYLHIRSQAIKYILPQSVCLSGNLVHCMFVLFIIPSSGSLSYALCICLTCLLLLIILSSTASTGPMDRKIDR